MTIPPEPIRIFIGSEPKTKIFCDVLMFSIRRRTSKPVEFTVMDGTDSRFAVPESLKQGTGFSYRRWLIPRACNFTGRAIYMDADQLVLHDVWDLWTKPDTLPGPAGACAWLTYQPDKYSTRPWAQTSVMVINCHDAGSSWCFRPDELFAWSKQHAERSHYVALMHCAYLSPEPVQIENNWNALNTYEKGKTKLAHFTSEPNQPTVKPNHPLAYLWQAELSAAIQAGAVCRVDFEAALAKWGVKEDWRSTNGLHPYYKKFLRRFRA